VCLEICGYIAQQFTSRLKGAKASPMVDDHVERIEQDGVRLRPMVLDLAERDASVSI
jgi:hypothetical protein